VLTTPAFIIAAVLVSQLPATLPTDQDRKDAPEPQQRSAPGRTKTDQTVNVQKGSRVDLTSCAGNVIVKTWERDAVRVQGEHLNRTRISITPRDQVVLIAAEASGRSGGSDAVDYELTVPAWINLNIDGDDCNMEITGLTGNVRAKTTDGEVVLRGLGGNVEAESVDGKITVDGGRGKIHVSTVDDDIEISKASGEIVAESIDGDVKLSDLQATSIDASSVDGDVTYTGALQASGRFQFTTHDGSIMLFLPESTSATFGIRTFQGALHSSLPLKAAGPVARGRRVTYTLGGGSAQVEIETFDGDVYMRKPGEPVKKDTGSRFPEF
jgi:DUF4097 and DUF4098 domain-containing protein YvlB